LCDTCRGDLPLQDFVSLQCRDYRGLALASDRPNLSGGVRPVLPFACFIRAPERRRPVRLIASEQGVRYRCNQIRLILRFRRVQKRRT